MTQHRSTLTLDQPKARAGEMTPACCTAGAAPSTARSVIESMMPARRSDGARAESRRNVRIAPMAQPSAVPTTRDSYVEGMVFGAAGAFVAAIILVILALGAIS